MHSMAAASGGMLLGMRWKEAAGKVPSRLHVPTAGSKGTTQSPTDRPDTWGCGKGVGCRKCEKCGRTCKAPTILRPQVSQTC